MDNTPILAFVAGLSIVLPAQAQVPQSEIALEQIVIPLEVLPLDLARAAVTGSSESTLTVELHQPLRAAAAIILRNGESDGTILPLAILGNVLRDANGDAVIPSDPAKRAWCTHDRGMRLIVSAVFTCWQDLDGDGRLETERNAIAATYAQPLTIAAILRVAKRIEPRPYRIARPDERNAYDLEYAPCGSLANGRYRRKLHGSPGPSFVNGCSVMASEMAQGANGDRQYKVERIVFSVSKSGQARLVSGLPVGGLLDRFGDGEDIVDLGTRKSFSEERSAALAPFTASPFQFAAVPTVRDGIVPDGQALIEGPMRYGYTGRLKGGLTVKTITNSRSLASGDPVYGVPMSNSAGGAPDFVWCAPQKTANRWLATCARLRKGTPTILLDRQSPAFAVLGMAYPENVTMASEVASVERMPNDLAKDISVRYRLEKWSRKKARFSLEILRQTEVVGTITREINLSPDGSALLRFGKGALRVTRSTDASLNVTTRTPIETGDSLLAEDFTARR